MEPTLRFMKGGLRRRQGRLLRNSGLRSGGMWKPGTAVPGNAKWNRPRFTNGGRDRWSSRT